MQFIDLADAPAMGGVGLAIGAGILLVLALLLLPAIALGPIQAIVLAVPTVGALSGEATLVAQRDALEGSPD